MGSSSGPSGETRVNWNDDMAPRWNNLLNYGLNTAFDVRDDGSIHAKPRATYEGTRFAPFTSDQNEAMDYTRNMARMSSSPIGAMNAARSQIEGTLGGSYLNGANANPYTGANGNEFINQFSTTDRNVFEGNNPYFRDSLLQGMSDVTDAYQRGTAADTTRMFNLSGAFGGSAHQQAMAANEAGLGKTLSSMANQAMDTQFNRSAGLEDSFLSRDLQNQQQNRQTSGNWREAQLGRGFSGYEGERGRQMQATGYGQNEQGLAFDRVNQLMGSGQMQQGLNQQNLDFLYDQWTQRQNQPFQMGDWLSGLYGRSVGSGGMNQSIYQGAGAQAAPWLGAALAGASLFG